VAFTSIHFLEFHAPNLLCSLFPGNNISFTPDQVQVFNPFSERSVVFSSKRFSVGTPPYVILNASAGLRE